MKLSAYIFSLLAITIGVSSLMVKGQNAANFLQAEVAKQYNLALEAIFGMGLRLQTIIDEDSEKNFLVSPISAAVVIAQLMLGADEKFRERLFDMLSLQNINQRVGARNINAPFTQFHFQMSQLLKDLDGHLGNFTLKERSALFYNNNTKLNTQFEWTFRKLYNADIENLDFEKQPEYSKNYINEWGSNNTRGLIKSILSTPPEANTGAIFVNSLYFLAEWQYPFSDILNREGPFTINENKQVTVTYMINSVEQIWYSESSTYKMINLPYKNDELGMYIILPKEDHPLRYKIKEFTRNLKGKEILETLAKSKRRDVTIKIPKMSISSRISILKQLQKFNAYKDELIKQNETAKLKTETETETPENNTNINEAGEFVDKIQTLINNMENTTVNSKEDIYLTNAADKPLKVSDIVQQVVFTINEKGTEAAAITASTIDYSGGAKNFIITRPFTFFIRHEATTATLFWGTISNPIEI